MTWIDVINAQDIAETFICACVAFERIDSNESNFFPEVEVSSSLTHVFLDPIVKSEQYRKQSDLQPQNIVVKSSDKRQLIFLTPLEYEVS